MLNIVRDAYILHCRQCVDRGKEVNHTKANPLVNVKAFRDPGPPAVKLTTDVQVCLKTVFFMFDVKDTMQKSIRGNLRLAWADTSQGAIRTRRATSRSPAGKPLLFT